MEEVDSERYATKYSTYQRQLIGASKTPFGTDYTD